MISAEKISIRLALLAGLLAVSAVAAYRLEWIGFQIAVPGLAIAALSGLLAALSGVIALFGAMRQRKSAMPALTGMLLGLVVALPVLLSVLAGSGVPRIHDISTDLDHPPDFNVIRSLRAATDNPLDRKSPDNLDQLQREGYPELKSLMLNRSPEVVFEQALKLVESRGWHVVGVSTANGIIEATAITPIMAFKDDVIIRIQGTEQVTRVDMRSVSRVGISDLGVNAKRIGRFLADLKQPTN
ncbi:MAG: DUF1499 domain-containing protein [Nitrosomonas sp.]|nr:DUF1499 domain-containing protein [Nitrosomonas sp.]